MRVEVSSSVVTAFATPDWCNDCLSHAGMDVVFEMMGAGVMAYAATAETFRDWTLVGRLLITAAGVPVGRQISFGIRRACNGVRAWMARRIQAA